MKKRDLVAAACWVILGLIISIWSSTFPFVTSKAAGPAVFPFACGLILILLGSVLFFQVWKQSEGKATTKPLIPHGAALKRVAMTLGGMFLSAIFLDHLGFVLTMFFLILFLLRGVQPKKWGVDLFYTSVFTLACYMIFEVLFKTELPRGFLGF